MGSTYCDVTEPAVTLGSTNGDVTEPAVTLGSTSNRESEPAVTECEILRLRCECDRLRLDRSVTNQHFDIDLHVYIKYLDIIKESDASRLGRRKKIKYNT